MHTYTHAISGGCSTESHWYAGDVYEFGFCLDKFIDLMKAFKGLGIEV